MRVSKKFAGFIIGIASILTCVLKASPEVAIVAIQYIALLTGVYTGGQAFVDHQKEKPLP